MKLLTVEAAIVGTTTTAILTLDSSGFPVSVSTGIKVGTSAPGLARFSSSAFQWYHHSCPAPVTFSSSGLLSQPSAYTGKQSLLYEYSLYSN